MYRLKSVPSLIQLLCHLQWSVLLPVVLMLIATQNNDDNKIVDSISKVCYTKWALEAFVIANAKR